MQCHAQTLSHVRLFVTLWTITHQVPLSMGFFRQEYWSGLLFPPPGDLYNPGIKPASFVCLALAGKFFTTRITWEAQHVCMSMYLPTHMYLNTCYKNFHVSSVTISSGHTDIFIEF